MSIRLNSFAKKTGAVSLAAVMISGMCIASAGITAAAANDVSGSCGDGLSYVISGGTLTVSGVGEIDSSAFEGNTSIKKAVLGNGVSRIGSYAFAGCSNMESISMNGVTSISYNAFSGSGLRSVRVPDCCTLLGSYAFSDCTALESAQLSSSLYAVQTGTFQKCTALKEMQLPASVGFVGPDAFDYCDSLSKLYVYNSNANFAPFAFGYYRFDTSSSLDLSGGYWDSEGYHITKKMQEDDFDTAKTALHNNLGHSKYTGFTAYGQPGSNLQKYCSGYNMYITTYSMMIGDPDDPWNAYYVGEEVQTIHFDNQLAFSVVNPVADTGLEFDKTSMTLAPGEIGIITANVLPENCTDKTLEWESSNESVAEIDNGIVTALGSGTTTIKATTVSGKTKTCKVTVAVKPLVNNSYTVSNMVAPGSKLGVQGVAEGGTAPYTYAFYLRKVGSSTWNVVRDYTENSYCNVKPNIEQKDYEIRVDIKDKTGKKVSKTLTVFCGYALRNNTSLDLHTAEKGVPITIRGAAEGGKAPYKYAFYFRRAGNTKWNVIGTEFSSRSNATLTPSATANYEIRTVVKDAKGDTAEWTSSVKGGIALKNNSFISSENVLAGSQLKISGRAEGGSGTYTFCYKFKRAENSKWNVIGTPFTAKTYAKFTVSEGATYDVLVIARDGVGEQIQKKWVVKTHKPLENNSTVSTSTVKAGTSVRITAAAAEGVEPYQYTFRFRRAGNTKWNIIGTENGKKTSATLTPTSAAKYEVIVKITDASGYSAEKAFTITAT